MLSMKEALICSSWRAAILTDDQLLKRVHFKDAQSALPLMRRYSEGSACPKATGLPITQLIDKVTGHLCSLKLTLERLSLVEMPL